jgi:hypothetical protein
MQAYCVDVGWKGKNVPIDQLEVCQYDQSDLKNELEKFKADRPEKLSDHDRHVFSSDEAAEKFLSEFKKKHDELIKNFSKKKDFRPCLLYTRRYLVLALMGLKLGTARKYDKKWNIGQPFYLYDQIIFLPAELTSLEKKGNFYHYNFKLQV